MPYGKCAIRHTSGINGRVISGAQFNTIWEGETEFLKLGKFSQRANLGKSVSEQIEPFFL